MAAPSMVFTARYAAHHLGVDIEAVEGLAMQMEPEDGCLSIIDSLDEEADSITAFTSSGLHRLEELLDDRRSAVSADGTRPCRRHRNRKARGL